MLSLLIFAAQGHVGREMIDMKDPQRLRGALARRNHSLKSRQQFDLFFLAQLFSQPHECFNGW